MENPKGFFGCSFTTGGIHLSLHEGYWNQGEFTGTPEQNLLMELFRHQKVLSPTVLGQGENYGAHCSVFNGQNGALTVHAMLAKGLEGFEAGRQYAMKHADFPEAVIQQMPANAQDACFSFSITELQQEFVKASTGSGYYLDEAYQKFVEAGANTSVKKMRFVEANLPYYALQCHTGSVLIVPVEKINTVDQFNDVMLQILNSRNESVVNGEGRLQYPIIGKTKLPINIDGLVGARIPGSAIDIAGAKGIMQFELGLKGYESRTEATMLSVARSMGSWEEPNYAFDEEIKQDFIVINQVSGKFVEAVYVSIDELLNA